MSKLPNCPECNSEYTYEYSNLYVCPECAHEWSTHIQETTDDVAGVKDANGNLLIDGDNAIMIKDVKIKGSSEVIKQGTKVQGIRIEDNGAHNIVAKVDGFGVMELKSELIKKN